MVLVRIDYQLVLKADLSGEITSLIAYQALPDKPFQAVLWSVRRTAWIYAPGLAVPMLYDDKYQDRTRVIDRAKAEKISRESLSTELPSEATLQSMCEEGERMGWNYGPPRP
ncbi:hypothetical protein AFR_42790 [Actinoplanes friuliensis DSM 7358]|uniref:Uncharacterized protein n=1 Tax=Actinoplanes friuliensis DSM 7358 TaxID=1246995 RepID=U5WCW0_9ACTN|nr:hypothetical protein AFR_42790 [Actinoplanes friuliensis DSM 7358]